MVPAHLIVNAKIALSPKEMVAVAIDFATMPKKSAPGEIVAAALTGDFEAAKMHAKGCHLDDAETAARIIAAMEAKM